MSLVDPTHVEGTRDRNNCHYQMVPGPNGLTMGMSLWYKQEPGYRCTECFFKPFFHDSHRCPKCGGRLEME